ncbi:MAG: rubrerythrin [Oscillospiraceae bacterium]|nr:rubrerythrin [Oscillospiraceae bacterium]
MGLKNTKTEENLRKALAGESIARNKYTYFAQAARACGNEEVAAAFEEMAKNEMTHARFWFEQLYGKPTDVKECVMKAAHGEYEEWHGMYPAFAEQARQDGLEDLAVMFEHVAAIERSHENRFMTLLAKLAKASPVAVPTEDQPKPALRTQKMGYRCQFCGVISPTHQDVCPVCQAIGAFQMVEYYE